MDRTELHNWVINLDMSVRTTNCLRRVFDRYTSEEQLKRLKESGYFVGDCELSKALLNAETITEVKELLIKNYPVIRNLGRKSYEEMVRRFEKEKDEMKQEKRWHKLSVDGLPPLGIPLIVRAKDGNLRYPVYYIKNPYDFSYRWCFLPVLDSNIHTITPESLEFVEEWIEMQQAISAE